MIDLEETVRIVIGLLIIFLLYLLFKLSLPSPSALFANEGKKVQIVVGSKNLLNMIEALLSLGAINLAIIFVFSLLLYLLIKYLGIPIFLAIIFTPGIALNQMSVLGRYPSSVHLFVGIGVDVVMSLVFYQMAASDKGVCVFGLGWVRDKWMTVNSRESAREEPDD